MPMSSEVAQATVSKLTCPDDPDITIYSLSIPGIGEGYGDVKKTTPYGSPELGFFKATPERCGIGARLLLEAASDLHQLGFTSAHGEIVHGPTINLLTSFMKTSLDTGRNVIIPRNNFHHLPVVKLLRSGLFEVYELTVKYKPTTIGTENDLFNYQVLFYAEIQCD